VRKCPYCDFNSHVLKKSLPEEAYIKALIRDLDQQLPKIWGRRLTSIFFGGGTPSLFSAQGIERILKTVHSRLPFMSDLEITLEANPGTFEQKRFSDFRKAGINRLSIGVQSFNDAHLKKLGRIHGAEEAKHAITQAQKVGFDNMNLDIMYGLPEQTLEQAQQDLEVALSFTPQHLSYYQLTLEPNTLFYAKPPKLPAEEMIDEMQIAGDRLLTSNGFEQYEVSAYAQPNQRCAHNLNYWEFGDYLGLGAGAHSKLTNLATEKIERHHCIKHPQAYMEAENAIVSENIIQPKELPFEFMLNCLRLTEGFSKGLFEDRTGLSLKNIQPILKKAKEKELLKVGNIIQPTILGKRFLNDLTALFLNASLCYTEDK